jgi:hypothetical protein
MVNQMPESLLKHAEEFRSFTVDHFPNDPIIEHVDESLWTNALDSYVDNILDLAKNAQVHESIDTYAKKLFLLGNSGRERLRKLKLGLTCYFTYLQASNGLPDKRYDGFLASVLESHKGFPVLSPDLFIMSWNYDQQMQYAYQAYVPSLNLWNIGDLLGLSTLDMLQDKKEHRLVHLNGIASWGSHGQIIPIADRHGIEHVQSSAELMEVTLRHWALGFWGQGSTGRWGPRSTLLRFAWEVYNATEDGMNVLKGYIQDCTSLVVIGYSFPFFNRSVDRRIIANMPDLKRVYLQAPPNAVNDVMNAFRAIPGTRDLDIETYPSVDKFLLPPEL